MLRKELEGFMKLHNMKTIDLVVNEKDPLGMHCHLSAGILKNCWDRVIDRKANLWGYLDWKDGKFTRRPLEHLVEKLSIKEN